MRYLRWVILITLSTALGVFIVEFMTVHPLRMSTFLLLSSAAAFAIAVLIALAFRGRRLMPLAIAVAVIFLAVGYVLDKSSGGACTPRPARSPRPPCTAMVRVFGLLKERNSILFIY